MKTQEKPLPGGRMRNKVVVFMAMTAAFLVIVLQTEGTILNGGTSTNCSAYGCIYITSSYGNMAIFDGGGFVDIKGNITEGSVGTPDGADLIVKNSEGSTVLWIDGYNGNMRLSGTIADNRSDYCTPPAGSFVIKDKSGNCVAFINSTGHLWARGLVRANSTI